MKNLDRTNLDCLAVSAIRAMCIDITNKAKSGHPGMPLGSAPILYTLFKNHLVANPHDPYWINRDRFVLSAGHASALLYTMLHLCGYGLSIEDLKSFRQLDSLTPGHPEFRHTKGVEATTGPLGQGLAQAVGMAVAEQAVKAQHLEGNKLINHYTYCLVGDGCLNEGISQEAISFAGHQRLSKLIVIYDANQVMLDGDLSLSFSENVELRFLASNWNVLKVKDGNDLEAVDKAIRKAKKSLSYPTLIIVNTIIGYGSSKQGTSKVHGNPLGVEDGQKAKNFYGYNYPDFTIPQEVYDLFNGTFVKRGVDKYQKWKAIRDDYKDTHPEEYRVFEHAFKGDVTNYIYNDIPKVDIGSSDSTRSISGHILNELHNTIPFIMGGSADVASSVMTKINNGTDFTPDNRSGRNIHFGIREFAMAAIQNGMLLHGGVKTYVGSFLVFSDYMKSAIRTACLSRLPAIYLFSHDSIALGEDGPTHQPIEHLAMLRSIPNMRVIRPCDNAETYGAWRIALKSKETPTALILSRQGLPEIEGTSLEGVAKGGYVVAKEKERLMATIIATGSEVSLAIKAQKLLLEKKIDVRVVSMPSIGLFDAQEADYRKATIGISKDKVIAVEMLSTFGWHRLADTVMGIDQFGTSAPMNDAVRKFDFTSERLASIVEKVVKSQ
ncbi:MAG: transketolase [Bacilli bacterium]|jgi:transketolase